MVSNALNMSVKELVANLERIKRESASGPDYQKIRSELPEEWPL